MYCRIFDEYKNIVLKINSKKLSTQFSSSTSKTPYAKIRLETTRKDLHSLVLKAVIVSQNSLEILDPLYD